MAIQAPMTARQFYYELGKALARDHLLGERSLMIGEGKGEVAANRLEIGYSSGGDHVRVMPVTD